MRLGNVVALPRLTAAGVNPTTTQLPDSASPFLATFPRNGRSTTPIAVRREGLAVPEGL